MLSARIFSHYNLHRNGSAKGKSIQSDSSNWEIIMCAAAHRWISTLQLFKKNEVREQKSASASIALELEELLQVI